METTADLNLQCVCTRGHWTYTAVAPCADPWGLLRLALTRPSPGRITDAFTQKPQSYHPGKWVWLWWPLFPAAPATGAGSEDFRSSHCVPAAQGAHPASSPPLGPWGPSLQAWTTHAPGESPGDAQEALPTVTHWDLL